MEKREERAICTGGWLVIFGLVHVHSPLNDSDEVCDEVFVSWAVMYDGMLAAGLGWLSTYLL